MGGEFPPAKYCGVVGPRRLPCHAVGKRPGLRRDARVGDWVFWVGLLSLVTMTLFATLNVALRTPSRGRIAEQFERIRGDGAFERFVARRPRYILATAILRSAAVTFLFFAVLYFADSGEPVWYLMRNVVACLVAFGLIVVFGVAIPYAWAKYAGEWLAVRCLPLLVLSSLLTRPAIVLVEIVDPVVRRLAGVPARQLPQRRGWHRGRRQPEAEVEGGHWRQADRMYRCRRENLRCPRR